MRREVLPNTPDAWYVPASVKTGYEISFARHFYKPQPLRSLEAIRADILAAEGETKGLLGSILGGSTAGEQTQCDRSSFTDDGVNPQCW